jgi:cephalosporin hydroxylase
MTPLEVRYREACNTPSDINEHLPLFVDLCQELDAKKVIELGTRGGVSTIAWLYGLKWTGGHCWSVDIDEAPDLKLNHWTFIQGDDLDPNTVCQLPDEADVVFIDTTHSFEDTLAELNVYQYKVRPGGRIVLHDTELKSPLEFRSRLPQPDFPVRCAVEQFCDELDWKWTNHPHNNGLGVISVPDYQDR